MEEAAYTKILIRDLRIDMLIGIYEHEKTQKQPVLVNITATLANNDVTAGDAIEHTVCYDAIIKSIRSLAAREHINLVETFAEKIAIDVLRNNSVRNVTVRVEKTAVYDFAGAVGVEIFRKR